VSSGLRASQSRSAPRPTPRRRRAAVHSAADVRPAPTATAQAVLPGTHTTLTPDIRAAASVNEAVDQAGEATTTRCPPVATARVATAAGATAGVAEKCNLARGSDDCVTKSSDPHRLFGPITETN